MCTTAIFVSAHFIVNFGFRLFATTVFFFPFLLIFFLFVHFHLFVLVCSLIQIRFVLHWMALVNTDYSLGAQAAARLPTNVQS